MRCCRHDASLATLVVARADSRGPKKNPRSRANPTNRTWARPRVKHQSKTICTKRRDDRSARLLDRPVPFARTNSELSSRKARDENKPCRPVFWLRTSCFKPSRSKQPEQWHQSKQEKTSITAARPRRIFTAFPRSSIKQDQQPASQPPEGRGID